MASPWYIYTHWVKNFVLFFFFCFSWKRFCHWRKIERNQKYTVIYFLLYVSSLRIISVLHTLRWSNDRKTPVENINPLPCWVFFNGKNLIIKSISLYNDGQRLRRGVEMPSWIRHFFFYRGPSFLKISIASYQPVISIASHQNKCPR